MAAGCSKTGFHHFKCCIILLYRWILQTHHLFPPVSLEVQTSNRMHEHLKRPAGKIDERKEPTADQNSNSWAIRFHKWIKHGSMGSKYWVATWTLWLPELFQFNDPTIQGFLTAHYSFIKIWSASGFEIRRLAAPLCQPVGMQSEKPFLAFCHWVTLHTIPEHQGEDSIFKNKEKKTKKNKQPHHFGGTPLMCWEFSTSSRLQGKKKKKSLFFPHTATGLEWLWCNGVRELDECSYLCWKHWDAGQFSIRLHGAKSIHVDNTLLLQ